MSEIVNPVRVVKLIKGLLIVGYIIFPLVMLYLNLAGIVDFTLVGRIDYDVLFDDAGKATSWIVIFYFCVPLLLIHLSKLFRSYYTEKTSFPEMHFSGSYQQQSSETQQIESAAYFLRRLTSDAEINGMLRTSTAVDYTETLYKIERDLIAYSSHKQGNNNGIKSN